MHITQIIRVWIIVRHQTRPNAWRILSSIRTDPLDQDCRFFTSRIWKVRKFYARWSQSIIDSPSHAPNRWFKMQIYPFPFPSLLADPFAHPPAHKTSRILSSPKNKYLREFLTYLLLSISLQTPAKKLTSLLLLNIIVSFL